MAVLASGTTVTDVYGIGPICAATIIGHVRDIGRFPTKGHFATYNATAPIEASSAGHSRHRLNPRGNRKVNHALHVAAVTQLRNDTEGRTYYDRKIAEGKSSKESSALSSAGSPTASTPTSSPTPAGRPPDHHRLRTGPGGHPGTALRPAWPARILNTGSSDKSLPGPDYNPRTPAAPGSLGRAQLRVKTSLDTKRLRPGGSVTMARMTNPSRSHCEVGRSLGAPEWSVPSISRGLSRLSWYPRAP